MSDGPADISMIDPTKGKADADAGRLAGHFSASRQPFRKISHRYSRFVGTMRKGLLLLAAILFALIVGLGFGLNTDDEFQITYAKLETGRDNQLAMVKPRFQGVDAKQRPFWITAERAVQSQQDQRKIHLWDLRAKMGIDGGAWLTLEAPQGIYHQGEAWVKFPGTVRLWSDNGYRLELSQLSVDLKAGYVETGQEVRGSGPLGEIRADGMEIFHHDQRLIFTGHVSLRMRPAVAKPKTAQ